MAHSHESGNYNRAFTISIVLNTTFVAIEAIYGILANFLVLLTDVGHSLCPQAADSL